ncbi:hypothetical protein [Bradyrhizobium liaoningense]|uniref:hypothetical protein n=1 Tax=Bradyrhizobium liaoningense TaxID=43992 RepID=UPI001BAE2604|nr:hypothetical protein [Bradyrhizobium liaoningense]MBR0716497.1 hypothetical protein [Bradyrhizobium liaoningense]
MAFDYWWIGLFVDEREHARIQPHFAAAAAESPLSAEAWQAIDDWRAHPREYEEDAWLTASDELASRVHAIFPRIRSSGVRQARKKAGGDGGRAFGPRR